MSRRRQHHYLSLAMHMRCNLRCEHCMIESTMDAMESYDDAQFGRVLTQQERTGSYRGLILTGAEITLRADLPDLARRARAAGFDRVRIQTHAMRFASPSYAESIVAAGVNEFFVSVTAGNAAAHDAITGASGSFAKTLAGLQNLDELEGVTLITNTVITTRSYDSLRELVERTGHLRRLEQVEFWNYWPMSPEDPRDLIADNLAIQPHLLDALDLARSLGREVVVQNYPECLLTSNRTALDNALARSEIDGLYWAEFDRNGFGKCPHRARCGSQECWGLTDAYVSKFGDQSESLVPIGLQKLRRG